MSSLRRVGWLLAAFGSALLLAPTLRAETPHAPTLRVVSFNTAMGAIVKLRSERGLRELFEDEPALRQADVLSLQEVCLNQRRQLGLYLSMMQRMHGAQYHYADYASAKRGEPCDKGQAIVSSYPIVGAGTLKLTSVGAARSAVWADLDLALEREAGTRGPGYDRVRIYSLHLSNRDHQNYVPVVRRSEQAEAVLEHALAFMRRHPRVPVIVSGDFNTLGTLSEPAEREPVVESFQQYFQASLPGYTSTFLVPYQLDWIFYSGLVLAWSGTVSMHYSDHLPVVADFKL